MPEKTPIPEDHPLKPINPYGANKLEVEGLLAEAAKAHGLPWLRFATSTRLVAIPMARSAKSMIRKRISFR